MIKILTIIGSFSGLMYCLYQVSNITQINSWYEIFGFDRFMINLIGIICASLTLLVTFKPNDPLPWHWLLLLAFGVLIIIFSWLIGGLFIIAGAAVGLFDAI